MPDIFISYSHKDDESPYYPPRGWVQCFYDALSSRMKVIRTENTDIWFDRAEARITGNTVLTPEIREKLHDTRVLVLVLSDAYAGSQWCADELRYFRDGVSATGGMRIGNHVRVAKVFKLPVEGFHFEDGDVEEAPGHQFWQKGKSGRPRELDPGTDFDDAINELAYTLRDLLAKTASIQSVASSGFTVYVADTCEAVIPRRDQIRSELKQFGHTVLPQAYGARGKDFGDLVASDLAKSHLSVHLIGDDYGAVPERSEESIVEIQYRLAGDEARKRPAFERFTWMPKTIAPSEPRQVTFAQKIENDPMRGLMRGSFETFKSDVGDALTKLKTAAKAPDAQANGEIAPKCVYLLFDIADEEATRPVRAWLDKQGFQVWKPTSDLLRHQEHLELSDGVLIYYGKTQEDWVDLKVCDLQKYVLRARRNPLRRIVVADPGPPERPDKADFTCQVARVIPGFGEFSPEVLEDFARELRSKQEAV
jgi:hypothetical protein